MQEDHAMERLERLSEAVVFADPSNPKSLAAVYPRLLEFLDAEQGDVPREVSEALSRLRRLLDKHLSGQGPLDPGRVVDILGQTLCAVQEALRQGTRLDLSVLPQEIGSPIETSGRDYPKGIELPEYIDEAIFAEFLARQPGVLVEMEQLVLALEQYEDPERLAELKRMIHTLKGEAALLGLGDVETLCHATEDALAKHGVVKIVDPLLAVLDWLNRTFEWCSSKGPVPEPVAEILGVLNQDRSSCSEAQARRETVEVRPVPSGNELPSPQGTGPLSDFLVESRGLLTSLAGCLSVLEQDATNREALQSAAKALHRLKGAASFVGLEPIEGLAMDLCQVMNRALRKKLRLDQAAVDLSLECLETLRSMVRQQEEGSSEEVIDSERLQSLRDRVKTAGLPFAPPPVEPLDQKAIPEPVVEKAPEADLENSQRAARALDGEMVSQKPEELKPHAVEVREAIRVDAGRLDRLIDMVGELVITESMVAQAPELLSVSSQEVLRHIGQLDKITRELQEIATSLRMIPIRQTFQKMARLVRDLARKAGKTVEFTMIGEDTELDKTVVDRIGDPLVHILRNAVDHGIETRAEERERLGKERVGRIELRAFHKGGNIHIEVEDDGRGLDREAILSKAREKGLAPLVEGLTDREIMALIFEPGFSTARTVTGVSGRGVGLDVVKRSVESLRGRVEVRSEAKKGTLFTIQLPLTLAIIDGMVVRIADQRYIVPTLAVVRSIRPKPHEVQTVLNRGEVMMIEGDLVPLIRVDQLFEISGAAKRPEDAIVMVVEEDGRRVGLIVDELLGQLQVVMKSIAESMQKVQGIAGGAIMPDGRVGLIMDIGGLVQLGHSQGIQAQEVEHVGN